MGDLVVTILVVVGVVAVTTALFGMWLIVTVGRGVWRMVNRGPTSAQRDDERICRNKLCKMKNPVQAVFCRRCGAHLQSVGDRRARSNTSALPGAQARHEASHSPESASAPRQQEWA